MTKRDKRVPLLVGGAILLLGVVWLGLNSESPEGEEEAEAVPGGEREEVAEEALQACAAAHTPSLDEPPAGVGEEALSAAAQAAGQGLIRCDLGHLHGEWVSPFARSVQDGGVLLASPGEPEGRALIRFPPPDFALAGTDAEAFRELLQQHNTPRALVVWGEAFPGEEGWCEVREVGTVTLSGVVVDLDGAPDPESWVNGCDAPSTYPDAEGRWEMEVHEGPPCLLSARSSGFGLGLRVTRDRDQSGLVVADEPLDAVAKLEHMADEVAELRAQAEPLEVALEQEGLSPEAVTLLGEWLDAERARLQHQQAAYEEMARMFGEMAD